MGWGAREDYSLRGSCAVMNHVQTVVLGAGVVGLAVARELARAGTEVLVLEAAPAIGRAVLVCIICYPTGVNITSDAAAATAPTTITPNENTTPAVTSCWCQYQSPTTIITFVRFLNTVIIGTFRCLNAMNEVRSMATKHTLTGNHFMAMSTSKPRYETIPSARQLSTRNTAAMHCCGVRMSRSARARTNPRARTRARPPHAHAAGAETRTYLEYDQHDRNVDWERRGKGLVAEDLGWRVCC